MSSWDNIHSKVEADRQYVAEPGLSSEQVYSPQFRVVHDVATQDRNEAILQTYRLLAVAVFAGMVGGYFGSSSFAVIKLFASGPGLILAFLVLNFMPRFFLNQARANPKAAVALLGAQGLFSGLVLSPILFLGAHMSGAEGGATNLVHAAMIITGAVFLGVSGYVYQSGRKFTVLGGLMPVFFWAITSAMVCQYFFIHTSTFGMMLSAAVGVFGGIGLLFSTGTVLNDPDYRDPALGALAIFASLFNIFQSILSLLIGGGRRD